MKNVGPLIAALDQIELERDFIMHDGEWVMPCDHATALYLRLMLEGRKLDAQQVRLPKRDGRAQRLPRWLRGTKETVKALMDKTGCTRKEAARAIAIRRVGSSDPARVEVP